MKWSRIDPVLYEGKSGSEAIKKHATVPEEWTTQQFSMQDAELCGTIVSTSRQEIANNNRKQQAESLHNRPCKQIVVIWLGNLSFTCI